MGCVLSFFPIWCSRCQVIIRDYLFPVCFSYMETLLLVVLIFVLTSSKFTFVNRVVKQNPWKQPNLGSVVFASAVKYC